MATSKQRRPADHEYWCAAWSRTLFAGDIFQAVPFHTPPTEIYEDEYTQEQHYFAQLGWGYGLLISPTCDMYESVDPERIAHPFRTVVPILPLAEVTERTRAVAESVGLLRSRDQLTAYMYLPPLAEFFGESVACLYRPTVVTDDFLADPPRRIAQMQPEARRHLKGSSLDIGRARRSTLTTWSFASAARMKLHPRCVRQVALTVLSASAKRLRGSALRAITPGVLSVYATGGRCGASSTPNHGGTFHEALRPFAPHRPRPRRRPGSVRGRLADAGGPAAKAGHPMARIQLELLRIRLQLVRVRYHVACHTQDSDRCTQFTQKAVAGLTKLDGKIQDKLTKSCASTSADKRCDVLTKLDQRLQDVLAKLGSSASTSTDSSALDNAAAGLAGSTP
jgi:hypothetical protein